MFRGGIFKVLEHFYLKTVVPLKIGPADISIINLILSIFAGVGIFIMLSVLLAVKPEVVPGKYWYVPGLKPA